MSDETTIEVRADKVRRLGSDGVWKGFATGKDVIIGFVDSGIQYKSKSFRNKDGTSRILFIYDMTQPITNAVHPDGGTEPDITVDFLPGDPFTFKSGVEYKNSVITNALENDIELTQVDEKGHGTLSAGIAASNGFQTDKCSRFYSGMAPEAKIIMVKLNDGALDRTIVNAICYIVAKAKEEKKAAVINLSINNNTGGFHNGTNVIEKTIDHLLQNPPIPGGKSLSIVTISGNFRENLHTTGVVNAASRAPVRFATIRNIDDKAFEVWFRIQDGLQRMKFKIISPKGEQTADVGPLVNPGQILPLQNDGRVGFQSIEFPDPDNPGSVFQVIKIQITPPKKEPGFDVSYFSAPQNKFTRQWTIELINENASDNISWHAWSKDKILTFEDDPNVTTDATVSIPGTSKHAITVGGHVRGGGIMGESGRGTTNPGEIKPEITAPGSEITSIDHDIPGCCARFWCCCCNIYHTDSTGTSLASPFVAGAIALILELRPTLTNVEIRNFLFNSRRTDTHTGTNLPNITWGFGKLDVEKLVKDVNATLPIPRVFNASPADAFALAPNIEFADGIEGIAINPSRLRKLEEEFMDSPGGKFLHALAEKHFAEVTRLINYNKQVATIWHRNDGPLLLRLFGRSVIRPDTPVPSVVNGRSVTDRLMNMARIMKKFASDTLAIDIDQQLPLLLQLEGKTTKQVLEFCKNKDNWQEWQVKKAR